MKSIVITGVSSGIGMALVKEYATKGYLVYGSVRKEKDAQNIATLIGANYRPLIFDVTDEEAIKKAAAQVAEDLNGSGLHLLINNAGIVIPGPMQHFSADDTRKLFEVNIIGLISVTQAFLPLLGAKKNPGHPPGRIINISSVGGKMAFPFLGAYNATKHALEGISDAWRREMYLYNIDLITVRPGFVKTPIFDKKPKSNPYVGTDYEELYNNFQKGYEEMGQDGLAPEVVAQKIRRISEKRRPSPAYVVVKNRIFEWWMPKFTPTRMLDTFLTKMVGIK